MKRDVTRNGVRTQRGAVDDAVAAARRYFTNNLRDVRKQLGVDTLLGLASYEELSALHGLASPSSAAESRNRLRREGAAKEETVALEQYAPLGHRQAHLHGILSSLPMQRVNGEKKRRAEESDSRKHRSGALPVKQSAEVVHAEHPRPGAGKFESAVNAAEDAQDELSALLSDIVHHVERLIFK
jgi:hypothetical protein